MLKFKGYDALIEKVYAYKQEHVFEYWDILTDNEKESLMLELSAVDFSLMKDLAEKSKTADAVSAGFSPAPYIPLSGDKNKDKNDAVKLGEKHIAQGKTAVLLVAGGQGTRLGFDGPKGMFPVGPVSNKSLFQIHAEKIVKYSQKYNVVIPWYIMTSKENHEATAGYFKKCAFFGLAERDVVLFSQNMIPTLDKDGKIALKSKSSLLVNPDGHGGTLTALQTSGSLADMQKRGVETISYFQVDNPLVKIIDPVFVGYHISNNADVSSKGVQKASPEEKVGVFVKFDNGNTGIVEYSDLPREKQNERDEAGNLRYNMGNIAIHLFKRTYIEELTGGTKISLSYHIARKKIEVFKNGTVQNTDGIKFEKFIFDALSLTAKNILLETVREHEFAPVKNATGVDSVESAKELMSSLHKSWLKQRNVSLPDSAQFVEISPLAAVEPDDLSSGIKLATKSNIYIE